MWEAMGRPPVPAVVIDDQVVGILHVSQVASLLGVAVPDTSVGVTRAWDTVTVLDSWLALIAPLSWEELNQPTPSRGRTPRNLTVNVFRPFGLLPDAFDLGSFPWTGAADAEVEAGLPSAEELTRWADRVLGRWRSFLLDRQDDLRTSDPAVETVKGTVPFTLVLTAQRYHSAAHHRQLVHHLRAQGWPLTAALAVETLPDLDLAPEVF